MIVGDPSVWNKDAALILKQFLDSTTGKLFLAHLAYRRAPLSGVSDIDAVALQAKFVAGYESAIFQILSLAEPPEETEGQFQTNYPDIDDDSLWGKTEPKKE